MSAVGNDKRASPQPCRNFGQEFLTSVGGLQTAKGRLALAILRLLQSGLNQTQISKSLHLKRRQNVNFWVKKFSSWGWLVCDTAPNDRSGGKYYRLSNVCLNFLTTSEEDALRAVLASRDRVDNLRFEAVVLDADQAGWERLKSKLESVPGVRNWNRYVSMSGEFDGWTVEVHEGKVRKVLFLAGKRYGGRNGLELVSRVHTDCEVYARQLSEKFGLNLSPVSKIEGSGEFVAGAISPAVKLLAARNSEMENDVAKEDHSHPHRTEGEIEFKDAEVFDAYTHLPLLVRNDIARQENLDRKVSSLTERLERLEVKMPAIVQDSMAEVVDTIGTKLGEKIAEIFARKLNELIGGSPKQPQDTAASPADGRRYT